MVQDYRLYRMRKRQLMVLMRCIKAQTSAPMGTIMASGDGVIKKQDGVEVVEIVQN